VPALLILQAVLFSAPFIKHWQMVGMHGGEISLMIEVDRVDTPQEAPVSSPDIYTTQLFFGILGQCCDLSRITDVARKSLQVHVDQHCNVRTLGLSWMHHEGRL
jgi:hypothetical protein